MDSRGLWLSDRGPLSSKPSIHTELSHVSGLNTREKWSLPFSSYHTMRTIDFIFKSGLAWHLVCMFTLRRGSSWFIFDDPVTSLLTQPSSNFLSANTASQSLQKRLLNWHSISSPRSHSQQKQTHWSATTLWPLLHNAIRPKNFNF